MPLEKNQPLTLPILSRKTDGTANDATAPVILISKDGAAAVALSNTVVSMIENMPGAWKVALTADDLNCATFTLSHSGAGLEFYIQTLTPEGAYTAARGAKLDNADVATSSRLPTTGYVAPNNAAFDTILNNQGTINTNVLTRAEPGAAMTLTPGERNAIADACLDRVDGVEVGWTPRQVSRVLAAVLAGKAGGADSDNPFFRSLNDLKTRVAAVVDEDGNRISVTYDVS